MNTALLLLPDFSLILLGAGVRRWMHLGDHFWTGVEKLVYFILFPAMLINALTRTHLDMVAAIPLLATSFTTLFVIMDPPGTVPVFLALTGRATKATQRRAAFDGTPSW